MKRKKNSGFGLLYWRDELSLSRWEMEFAKWPAHAERIHFGFSHFCRPLRNESSARSAETGWNVPLAFHLSRRFALFPWQHLINAIFYAYYASRWSADVLVFSCGLFFFWKIGNEEARKVPLISETIAFRCGGWGGQPRCGENTKNNHNK